MNDAVPPSPNDAPVAAPHRRRPRYSGKHPRRFEEKYKEHEPQSHADTVAKVMASGRTPAGTHRPILVAEILEALAPQPGELVVDGTLGYGGHAREILARLQPGGRLIGLDVDPIELPKTEARLRQAGFGAEMFTAIQSNFAGLAKVLASENVSGADCILADLGVSSMQLDNPARGFSVKLNGPLDMRMNPTRGLSAAGLLQKLSAPALAELLLNHADEPRATELSAILAGREFTTTGELAGAIRQASSHLGKEEADLTVRRVFQALRIKVNEELSALDSFLRQVPACLNPGGRVVILTFHSGEDRRVKKSFADGLRQGIYEDVAHEVVRPSAEERHGNPRSSPAKLRWARKALAS